MHRRNGRRQRQARPLTLALRKRLIKAAGECLIDLRNRALLAVAYDARLLRLELAAPCMQPVREYPGRRDLEYCQ